MAEFPAKVSTQTSSPDASSGGGCCPRPDITFLRSIPGILMMVEILLGLLVWALIADTYYRFAPGYGWVMFVAIICWVLTIMLFTIILLQLQRRIPFIPWPLTVFIYHAAATVLYVTAFITCAASVNIGIVNHSDYSRRGAASFFACVVMIAYGANTFFSFMEWRGTGGNAASAQA
ncbi:plasmolipin [Bufo bufo]|uniref:plasmolipin n=1 Tax=Bufo bufo TaxID=8384 RepID=UPI001ABDCA70|nr:plasmolipin [Bufo bufo]